MYKKRLLGMVFMMMLLVGCLSSVQQSAEGPRGPKPDLVPIIPGKLSLEGQYYALVIGINDYAHFRDLNTAVNDAQAVAALLREEYGFKTRLLLDGQATRNGVLSAFDQLNKTVREQDHILIYYAGHGFYNEDTDAAYWLPHDSKKDNDINWIIADRITKYLKGSAARQILVVADSCYSGVLEPDRNIEDVLNSKNRARYLRKMLERPARILISSGGNEPVRDAVGGSNHSLFAKVFIESLRDISEPVFTSDELFHGQKIRERVSGQIEQTPEFKTIRRSGHDGGDFVFRRVNPQRAEKAEKLAEIARLQQEKSRYDASKVEDGELMTRLEEQARRLDAEVAASKKQQDARKLALAAEKHRLQQKAEALNRPKAALARRQAERAVPDQEASPRFVKGQVFQDQLRAGHQGPKMVWIEAGRFQMGDIQGGGDDDEQPVHWVSVARFAMGIHEITVGEFRQFVKATGYQTDGEKEGSCYTWVGDSSGKNWRNLGFSQSDNHPVVCVSWHDATAYAEWLTQQTGHQYRLPTEAEWEYAARAGTTTRYWWGNEIGQNRANCFGNECGDRFEYTAPVGSFAANPWKLHDTVGNVWEWTCSEYVNSYTDQESKCVSQKSGGLRALRGGAWGGEPRAVRAAYRSWYARDSRLDIVGFRLARH